MTSSEVRQSFLDFFKSKGHTIVPSSSLMPDSPGLLFTNAGMNQFVPIFLNERKPDVSKWPGAIPGSDTRAADTQKCIRAGGKHNDLEDVGLDTYHHTFFEMLGNWSYGDYFKKEAIDWAWELITEVWKFPKNRLYATVYSPDKAKNDPSAFDQEAYDFWAAKFTAAGLDPKVHIVYGNKKDNFWMMGETGPCGPCSELHVDLTPAGDTKGSLVNKGDARCIEIWNLVFIQFTANPDGTFSPLPAKHVDTGMGFERVTGIIQNTSGFTDFTRVISNYETDIFRPIFDKLEKLSGKKYKSTLPAQGLGSTGDSPVPVGDPPTGTPAKSHQAATINFPSTAPGITYSKRNLPHFEKPWAIYHIIINTISPRKLSPAACDIVFDCILHWRELRYRLVAACVMPDHTHFIIQPGVKEEDKEGNPIFWPLSDILHSIKSFSAKEINKLDNVKGTLWQEERYDRYMRSDLDLQEKFQYLCRNPWAAGLVKESELWPWLWTQDIEALHPYVPLIKRPGSTGDSPVPVGDPPTGTPATSQSGATVNFQSDASSHSVGQVARQDGPVARSTQPGATPEQIQIDIAFRVIADHIRTLSFSIADGILPGNNDRNYVLRRILRRAVKYGRTLGFHEPFFYKLVDVLADKMGDVFPEIRQKRGQVEAVIKMEEEAFNKTLDAGIALFDDATSSQEMCIIILPQLKPLYIKIRETVTSGPDVTEINEKIIVKIKPEMEQLCRLTSNLKASDAFPYGKRLSDGVGMFNTFFDLLIEEECPRDRFNSVFGKLNVPLTLIGGAIKYIEGLEPKKLSGETAFRLYDTYGFPLDLTELMARERGLTVDTAGFEKLMEEQRARARAAQKKEIISVSNIGTSNPTKFVGFDQLETPAKVLGVAALKDKFAVVLDTSSCYAEMGGQVGDTGELIHGEKIWRVTNTQKTGNTWLHILEGVEQATSLSRPATGRTEPGDTTTPRTVPGPVDLSGVPVGGSPTGTGESPVLPMSGSLVTLSVNPTRRQAIERHHTVTHLLHWALHEVVSPDATQKGSYVGPDKLTFDFSSAPLTPAQVTDIEKLVNERILENAVVSWTEVPYAEIKGRLDVMQFFGEKYGDLVRVVQIGGAAKALNGYSMELCGGTHTRATGEIGLFRIASESAVAAGVRRIEAVAGLRAYAKAKEDSELISTVAGKVNAPVAELEKKIESLLAHQKELEKQVKAMQLKQAAEIARSLVAKSFPVAANGSSPVTEPMRAIIENLGAVEGDFLQAVADSLKGQFKGVVVLGGSANNAVSLIATVSSEYTAKVQAGKIIQAIAPIVGGKGGGKPDNARGGGKDVAKLDEALVKAKSLLG